MPATVDQKPEKSITVDQPKYQILADQLRRQIQARELSPGDRLPTFAEMRSHYNVTSTTIERVYSLLEQENLIERQQGRGTFVIEQKKVLVGNIGFFFHTSSLANPYDIELLAGMRHEAALHGMEILLLNMEEDRINFSKVDAVLMYCDIDEALSLNLPTEFPQGLLFQYSPDFNCIVADDFEGAKMATRHLIEMGHRNIAYLLHYYGDPIGWQRLAGYRAAHQEAGIKINENNIKIFERSIKQSYRETGELAMTKWLKEDWRDLGCTAIAAQNDETAIGIIDALTSAGLGIPKDISVVGFDGTRLSDLCMPRLTTIKVPLHEIGQRAVKVLLDQIHGGVKPIGKIVLPVQLKLGESTATLSAGTC